MRFVIWPVLVLFLLGLQTTWFSMFHSEQAPDLLLLFILLYSLDEGPRGGSICGFVLGLLQDVLTFSMFGFHALTRGLVGYLVGSNRERVFRDNPIFYFILVAVISVVIKVVYGIVIMGMSWSLLNFTMFTINTGKYVFWNLVCAAPLWLIFTIVRQWLWSREKYYY